MGMWLTELRRNLPADIVLHVVGTKADIVARDPSKREVPFERCIAYVAENLAPGLSSTPPPTATPLHAHAPPQPQPQQYLFHHHYPHLSGILSPSPSAEPRSPSSKRSSGFWGQEVGWDACHEISAESGEGVDEVFRVVTRKLVEQNRKMQQALLAATATPGVDGMTPGLLGSGGMGGGDYGAGGGGGGAGGGGGYFDGVHPRASFRVGRDRRSWLFSPGFSPALTVDPTVEGGDRGESGSTAKASRRCC